MWRWTLRIFAQSNHFVADCSENMISTTVYMHVDIHTGCQISGQGVFVNFQFNIKVEHMQKKKKNNNNKKKKIEKINK